MDGIKPVSIQEITGSDLQVGDVIVSKSGELSYITSIKYGLNGHRLDTLFIHYKYISEDDSGRVGYIETRQFKHYNYRFVCHKPDNQTYWQLKQSLMEKATKALFDPSIIAPEQEFENESVALVTSSGPDRLENAHRDLNHKITEADVIRRLIENRVSHISFIINDMEKTVKKLSRVIGVFELYLGVNEKIIQIQQGSPAPANTPISIRQLVLFADEEVGDPTNGGINWEDVDRLDNWLVTDENYKKVLPETKGIVAIRPSRQKRWYTGFFGGSFFAVHDNDYRCYLLIRNGDNLYRIFTNVERVGTHFFPNQAKFKEILERMDGHGWDQEKAEQQHLDFARNAMLIQGLIDRTDILKPLERRPDVMGEAGDPLVNYIYDGELSLPDGRLYFNQWKDQINAQITRGTRVCIGFNIKRHLRYKEYNARFKRSYRNSILPPLPEPGIYTVKEIISSENKFVISYNPKDEVMADWYTEWHTRKNNLSFYLYCRDPFVMNYDLLDLESIEFYLNSRIERQKYLDLIPVLWELRKQRLAELEWEKHFVNLLSHEQDKSEAEVWAAIEWWKNRVIWKRPIMQDDKKAHRMIKRKLKGAWAREN